MIVNILVRRVLSIDMNRMKRRIGAHVTTAGGLGTAIEKAKNIGANCIQIFSSPPQQWRPPSHSAKARQLFKTTCEELDITPVYVHGTYLINLASDNPISVQQSIHSLIEDLIFCKDIGSPGVIFHMGSHSLGWSGTKRESLMTAFTTILAQTPPETAIIVENSAGGGTKIPKTPYELSQIQKDLNSNRIKFCLDTAHAFAAGYDLRTRSDVDTFVLDIEEKIGWKSVAAIHANDSKVVIGCGVDRHENIGKGFIGYEGFTFLLTHPLVEAVPIVLEVPGYDDDGPDKENIDSIKRAVGII